MHAGNGWTVVAGRLVAALAALIALSAPRAQAASVLDVNAGDANTITSVTANVDPANDFLGVRTGVRIAESYGEQTLEPYDSVGGFALVSPTGLTFDKVVTIEAVDQHSDWDSMYIEFVVTNDTTLTWTDYHLEFYTSDFSQPLGLTLLTVTGIPEVPPTPFGNTIFDQSSPFGGTEIDFSASAGGQDPGEVNTIWLRWDWGNPGDRYEVGDSIGIRQIATAVPEPGVASLLGLALGALALGRRRVMRRH